MIIAIFLSCMGLFGLVRFTAEQRTREIGIRKVLGASVSGIVAMLSKDFLMPVLISIGIATPVSWWFLHRWLQDFAYRINISWWIFVLAGLSAILAAMITVSFQAERLRCVTR
ncbi:MAG: ABC transporter permease [Chitinophagales bacterium]